MIYNIKSISKVAIFSFLCSINFLFFVHTIFNIYGKVPIVMKTISSLLEPLFFICLGGIIYYFIEIAFRGESHYSMILCGGIAFYTVSFLNRHLEDRLSILSRMILSALLITLIEFWFGVYFNLYLHEDVWDYSGHFIQYKGQVCLTFTVIWFFLSLPLFWVEKYIRSHIFRIS